MTEQPAKTEHPELRIVKTVQHTMREMQETLVISLQDAERATDRLRAENTALKDQLAKATHERDFYQRHSMKLVTRLNDISLVISQSMREAKDAAYAPSLAPTAPAVDPVLIEQNLAAALEGDEQSKPDDGKPPPTFLRNGPAPTHQPVRLPERPFKP